MMPKETMNSMRQVGVVVAVIATIVVNVLANALPINGLPTGAIAARFDVLFMPEAYVFSIWGLIYLGLLAYAIYQVQPSLRNDKRLRSLDTPFLISSAANMGWLLLWHYEHIVASFVAMLVLLGSLISVYRRLDPERSLVSTGRRWAVHIPFSVYLGWVMVASVINLAVVLDSVGWTGWGINELTWFTVAVVGVLAVAAMVAWRRADVAFLLTLVWAFIGLGVEHQMDPLVATVAWMGTAALAVLVALAAIRQSPEQPLIFE